MKHLSILIVFCFSAIIFAQAPNWTSVRETNINYGNSVSFDIFTNSDGNHIIVQESNALKYYKMNVNGVAGTPVTLEENSAIVSPTISGNATNIYVVYRKSNETFIRTKYSTDGGSTWLDLANLIQNGSSIESVMSNDKLHITYQIGSSVYYSRNLLDGSAWSTPYPVSETETGTLPRIAAWHTSTEDKVYIIYNNSLELSKWREYNVANNVWGIINEAFNVSQSWIAGLAVDANNVYAVASFYTGSYQNIRFYTRNRQNNSIVSTFGEYNPTSRIHSTVTSNGEVHMPLYWYYVNGGGEEFEPAIYRKKGNALPLFWDQVYIYPNAGLPEVINISSAGNDVHVIWKDYPGSNGGNNLRYIYDDQVPLAPKNLTVTNSANNHPLLSWTRNNEPDVQYYKIYKWTYSELGWFYLATTTSTSFQDVSETILSGGAHANERWVYYRITAVDQYPYESPSSNQVGVRVRGEALEKSNTGTQIFDYSLSQNYPNPFNPSTKISYSIKEDGFVTLKIYDLLGSEVAVLVNEIKPEGNHSVSFDARQLQSGVYIYSLRVNDFVQNRKMTLLK